MGNSQSTGCGSFVSKRGCELDSPAQLRMTAGAERISSQDAPKWGFAAFGVFIVLVWAGLVTKLTTDWSTNPQYEFGYFVPVFIGYLLFRRWEDRPLPGADSRHWLIVVAIAVTLALLLPIRIIQEANPDWRPFNWVHAAVVISCSLFVFARLGGSVWARHFGVPLLLILFALPWPLAVEQGMIKELTGAVTRATVELLNWINVPALQRGNIIELASGSVGVADACSGMRSLAGTLMAAAFFGEYYRMSWSRRLFLIGSGCFIAFGLNIIRTFFLGWRTATEGPQAVEIWHDPAGFTIFAVSFAALWTLARVISRPKSNTATAPVPPISPLKNLPILALACSSLWLAGIYALTEGWYRYREGKRAPSVNWTIQLPQQSGSVRDVGLPDEVRSILRYSEGSSSMIEWPDGRNWNLIVLQWDPGRSSAQLATMHRPEICMPAAGYGFIGPAAPLTVSAGGVVISFDGSAFEASGQPLYVYRCLWEESAGVAGARERNFDMSIQGRLLSSWYGRRNLGQRLVQIGVSGVQSDAEAREDISRRLPGMIAPKT